MKKTLPVALNDDQVLAKGEELSCANLAHDAACDQLEQTIKDQRNANKAFRLETIDPIKRRIETLAKEIRDRAEQREIECIERESIVNGAIEIVRTDTGEVIETRPIEQPRADANDRQPSLFAVSPPPELPEARCTAVNDDGEVYAVSAESADAASFAIRSAGFALIDGVPGRVTNILRGKACGTCGIVPPFHRPECNDLREDDADAIEAEGGDA